MKLKENYSIPGSYCLTIDHYPCKFPFWYGEKVHFRFKDIKIQKHWNM